MTLDIIFLVLVLLLALLGYASGFLAQTLRIAALVGACFLAIPVSPHIEQLLARWLNADNLLGSLSALFLAWLLSYIVLVLAGKILISAIKGTHEGIRFLDRVMGTLLGGLKGALIVYLLACLLLLVQDHWKKSSIAKTLDMGNSRVLATVSQYNILSLTRLTDIMNLRDLAVSLHDPAMREKQLKDPRIQSLYHNEALKELMQDADFMEAAADRKNVEMLLSRKFRQALRDPEIRDFLYKWIPPEESKKQPKPVD